MLVSTGWRTLVLEVGGLFVGGTEIRSLKNRQEVGMQLKDGGPAVGEQKQVRVLCVDNHASSNLASLLLARSGYEVNCVKSIDDALDLLDQPRFDVCLINDELAYGSDEALLNTVKAASSVLFYSTVIYPFSPRLQDISGDTPETALPITDVAIAVNRTMAHAVPSTEN